MLEISDIVAAQHTYPDASLPAQRMHRRYENTAIHLWADFFGFCREFHQFLLKNYNNLDIFQKHFEF